MFKNKKFDFKEKDGRERLVFKISIFMGIYALINLYVLTQIYYIFSLNKNSWFWLFLVLGTFSYTSGAALIRFYTNYFAQIISVLGSVWMGFAALTSFIFLLNDLLVFLGVILNKKLLFLSIIFLVFYGVVNALFVHVRYINLHSKKVKHWLRVVQISDLHVGAVHRKNFLERIIKKVVILKPDVLLITGDLIDGKHKYRDHYFESFNKVDCPMFMVLGNHEFMAGIEHVEELLKKTKIKLLRDEQVHFKDFQIIGLDDSDTKKSFRNKFFQIRVDEKKFVLLMHHRPLDFKHSVHRGVDLFLCGHTHAGQVFPFNLLIKLFFTRSKGLYKYGSGKMYVSPGTGWWGPPMRLGSKNEITVFDIKP